VPRLVDALQRLGVDAELLSIGSGPLPHGLPAGTRFFPPSLTHVPVLNRFGHSAGLRNALMDPRENRSVIHGHGLWLKPNLDVAAAARQRGIPLVVSPRGMLAQAALRFSRFRKAVVRRIGQQAALD